jgi:hypothetical protein
MVTDWRSELVDLGDNVDAQAIVDAMTRAGYNKQQIAKALEAFMSETPAAGPETKPDTRTTLTVEQFIAMVKDPSKIEELKQILAKMDPKAIADLKAKIAPLLTSSADEEYQKKLLTPVIQTTNNINSIVSSQIPKRTKMLDVIAELNKILRSPAIQLKDDKGITYGDKIISMLTANKDKFGTTNTPGDKFVNILAASIKSNNPVEVPLELLETDLNRLRKIAGIV